LDESTCNEIRSMVRSSRDECKNLTHSDYLHTAIARLAEQAAANWVRNWIESRIRPGQQTGAEEDEPARAVW
jgi:hypothetical protein